LGLKIEKIMSNSESLTLLSFKKKKLLLKQLKERIDSLSTSTSSFNLEVRKERILIRTRVVDFVEIDNKKFLFEEQKNETNRSKLIEVLETELNELQDDLLNEFFDSHEEELSNFGKLPNQETKKIVDEIKSILFLDTKLVKVLTHDGSAFDRDGSLSIEVNNYSLESNTYINASDEKLETGTCKSVEGKPCDIAAKNGLIVVSGTCCEVQLNNLTTNDQNSSTVPSRIALLENAPKLSINPAKGNKITIEGTGRLTVFSDFSITQLETTNGNSVIQLSTDGTTIFETNSIGVLVTPFSGYCNAKVDNDEEFNLVNIKDEKNSYQVSFSQKIDSTQCGIGEIGKKSEFHSSFGFAIAAAFVVKLYRSNKKRS